MVKASPLSRNTCNTQRKDHLSMEKNICSKQIQRWKRQQELKTLYKKLREIIPSCQNKSVSSLDIILNAVEYINELHQALEEEYPGFPKPIPNLTSSPFAFNPNFLQISFLNTEKPAFSDVTKMTLSTQENPTNNLRN